MKHPRLRRTVPSGLSWLVLVLTAGLAHFGLADDEAPPQAAAGLQQYRYAKDDLGADYRREATTIKLWAPLAQTVKVLLFADPTNPATAAIPMSREADGIWSVRLAGDLDGQYYLYEITHPAAGKRPAATVRVNDPYARGCSANSGRTLIYDPEKTNPAGWAQDLFVPLTNNVDAVLYELHIRDFTINPNSGVPARLRGKYLGLVQPGTHNAAGAPTGLDHLKELGITHVHLLPAFDYAGGDERQKAEDYTWYNWGYDPVLYNTPEGSYATNPDGTARQKEFKEMVQALHRRRLGVVLDVVYNHTAATGATADASIFDKIYPGYYYRKDRSGRYANSTGCGNELASEKPMVRKFIVDSIKYWMSEYHVDGFRFDLMGILDRATMEEVCREARRINPGAILYGEGWQMERVLPPERMMTQAHVQGTGIAAFNDGIRNNIRGDNAPAAAGFVQGAGAPAGGLGRFQQNLKGQSTGPGETGIPVLTPNETINYDSAHDDLCLWDKLTASTPGQDQALRQSMDQLAAGILLTAQGVPFIHAGDEFLRSKNGDANSYNNNDPRVNPLDWSLKTRHRDVFEFYRGLIALRRGHPAFRLSERAAVDRSMRFLPAVPQGVVAFVLADHAGGDSWRNILVIYNGNRQEAEVEAAGRWSIVVNDQRAGEAELGTFSGRARLAACSLLVAHEEAAP